jgi:hypothetical protein
MQIERLLYTALVERDEAEESVVLPSDIHLYSRMDRFWALGCSHKWGFPFRARDMRYPRPYDTHQVCTECSRTRYYKFGGDGGTEPGPLFRRVIHNERVGTT